MVIMAAGGQPAPVRCESNTMHRLREAVQQADFLAVVEIPQIHADVVRAGRQPRPAGMECQAQHELLMTRKLMHLPSGRNFPYLDGAGPAGQVFGIGAEGHAPDQSFVAFQGTDQFQRLGIP